MGEKAEQDADPEIVARTICLRLLNDRPRTRRQLADALVARRVPAGAIEAVLNRFTEVGLVDDEAFAAAWVASRQRGRGLARRALRQELLRRGVEPGTVETALSQVDAADELAAAREIAARRLPRLAGLQKPVLARRLAGQLGRKGYSGEIVSQVIREALESRDWAFGGGTQALDLPGNRRRLGPGIPDDA